MSSAFRYCFTLNNYTEDEYSALRDNIQTHCRYGIIGKEIGESGTPHLQGYIIFLKRCSFTTAKDRLNPRCHVEVSNGSPRQNRDYCSKDGNSWEHGECPSTSASRGHNSTVSRDQLGREWQSAFESGREGMVRFSNERPGTFWFSRHVLLRNSLGSATAVHRPNINVKWFYGAPGTGKSRKAHEELPLAYIKDPRTKWWNGYLLEKDVIIDDFGPGGIDINHLLRWFDRYKCYVEVKGDMVPLCAVNFIVTSNFHPRSVFNVIYHVNQNVSDREDSHPQLPALMRRIQLQCFDYIIFIPKRAKRVRDWERDKRVGDGPTGPSTISK